MSAPAINETQKTKLPQRLPIAILIAVLIIAAVVICAVLREGIALIRPSSSVSGSAIRRLPPPTSRGRTFLPRCPVAR